MIRRWVGRLGHSLQCGILVDFTHGAALSTALKARNGGSDLLDDQGFAAALKELSMSMNP